MSVLPARAEHVACDGCGKEIKRGASVFTGYLGTLFGVDESDHVAMFQRREPSEYRDYHIWCLPNNARKLGAPPSDDEDDGLTDADA